jgi:hypothetical protein
MTSRNLVRRHFNEVGTSRRLPFSAKCSYIYIYIYIYTRWWAKPNPSTKRKRENRNNQARWTYNMANHVYHEMREFLSVGKESHQWKPVTWCPWSASLSAQLLLSRKVCEKSSCMFLEKQLLHRLQRSHSTGEWSLVTWIVIDSKLIYKIMVCYLWCYHIIYFIRLKI